jgi:hypothetical protein
MPRGAGEDKGAVSQLAREREKKRCGIISSPGRVESSIFSHRCGVRWVNKFYKTLVIYKIYEI